MAAAVLGVSNQTSFLRPITDGTIHAEVIRRHRDRTTWITGRRDDREDGAIDFDVVTELTFADRHADLVWSTDVGTGPWDSRRRHSLP
jgi:hypothetical protein